MQMFLKSLRVFAQTRMILHIGLALINLSKYDHGNHRDYYYYYLSNDLIADQYIYVYFNC